MTKNHKKPPKKTFQAENYFLDATVKIKNIRIWLAKFSIARAHTKRSTRALCKNNYLGLSVTRTIPELGIGTTNNFSEVTDDRPITCCSFTCDGQNFFTASLSGNLSVWSTLRLGKILVIEAHKERITAIATNPKSNLTYMAKPVVATSSADCTSRVWTIDGALLSTLTGHHDIVTDIKFHPSGRFLATSSIDQTWSLWDMDKTLAVTKTTQYSPKQHLYSQEGHHHPLYSISLQNDGSLLASGGSDTISRLWDLRTGRCIMKLEGHAQAVLTLDFSADGYRIVSGSLDQSCQIWDLRRSSCEYTIAAHNKLVKTVRCHPNNCDYFVSAGYDKEARIWSLKNYKLIRILTGHGDKVMDADINPNFIGHTVLTVSYDRGLRFW